MPATYPHSALPEAAAACSGLGLSPGALGTPTAQGPGGSPGAGGRMGARAPAPRSTPSSPCSPSGRAPARPSPWPPLVPGRRRRREGTSDAPSPSPPGASWPAVPGSGEARGRARGGDTGTRTQPVRRETRGRGGARRGARGSRDPGLRTRPERDSAGGRDGRGRKQIRGDNEGEMGTRGTERGHAASARGRPSPREETGRKSPPKNEAKLGYRVRARASARLLGWGWVKWVVLAGACCSVPCPQY